MAHITLKLTSLGASREICAGCHKRFSRGEQMSAIESEDDRPMGWFCDDCINDWKIKGVKSRVFEANR